MNNKFKLTALALALSLGFAGCAQEAGKKVDDAANDAKEKVEEVADDAKDKAEEVKDDAKDAAKLFIFFSVGSNLSSGTIFLRVFITIFQSVLWLSPKSTAVFVL